MGTQLKEGISFSQLLNGGAEFEINLENLKTDDASDEDEGQATAGEVNEAMLEFANLNCMAPQDDDVYVEGEPFEVLASKMEDLLPGGTIKKRVIREGYGAKPPEAAIVKIHYNAYIEYEAQPFDSTYARKRMQEFTLNNGEVLPCLDIAAQSMLLNEKAQFLVQPELAYRKLGCLGRVPPNAVVLFEIEMMEIVDSGAALLFHKLPEEKQKDFIEIYKYCLALCARAKDKFKRDPKESVRQYNRAVTTLEMAKLHDMEEQNKQQDLLLRLYQNLLVCYVKLEQPKKGCMAANEIFKMVKGTNICISAKVYYNNAKCLRMLGDFNHAKEKLWLASKKAPHNPDVANEFLELEEAIAKHKKREKDLAKGFVGFVNEDAAEDI